MSAAPRSFVDELAKNLSEKTGAKFEVLRRRQGKTIRYGLCVTRSEGYSGSLIFNQSMHINELKRWLAAFNDMIGMGYVLTLPQATLREWLAIRRNWEAIRMMLILQGEIDA